MDVDTGQYKETSTSSLSVASDLFSVDGTYSLNIPIRDPCSTENEPYANANVLYEPAVDFEFFDVPAGISACTPTSSLGTRDFYRFPIRMRVTSNSALSIDAGWYATYDTVSPTFRFAIKWNCQFFVDLSCDTGITYPYTAEKEIKYRITPELCLSPSVIGTAYLEIVESP
jgi:hypothetical protein